MFKYLKYNQKTIWKILLFKDKFNWAGFDTQDPNRKVSCELDLEKHLPERLQRSFSLMIFDFVGMVLDHNAKQRAKSLNSSQKDVQARGSNSKRPHVEDDIYVGSHLAYTNMEQLEMIQECSEPDDVHYIKELITTHFTNIVLELIEDAKHNMTEAEHDYKDAMNYPEKYIDLDHEEINQNYDEWQFQPHLGSHLKNPKPLVELVKYLADLFSLEEACKSAVHVFKRACFRKLHIGEFEDIGKFQEPSLEIILPQITCDKCQVSRNLDICKEYNEESKSWVCYECFNPYNACKIEKNLINALNTRLIAHQVQDFECVKCSMVKDNLMDNLCSCTGKFKNTQGDIPLAKLQNKNLLNSHSQLDVLIKLCTNIARIKNMKMLYRIAKAKSMCLSR